MDGSAGGNWQVKGAVNLDHPSRKAFRRVQPSRTAPVCPSVYGRQNARPRPWTTISRRNAIGNPRQGCALHSTRGTRAPEANAGCAGHHSGEPDPPEGLWPAPLLGLRDLPNHAGMEAYRGRPEISEAQSTCWLESPLFRPRRPSPMCVLLSEADYSSLKAKRSKSVPA